ncbi:MAG TPA: alpha/beta hydrolase [Candidatus Limnocylindria bacterium]|nr:alpha/beta hydrolase [Candidatus Limnocylindria bacterium]
MRDKTKKFFIKSTGGKIYVELGYPKGKLPKPAVIVAHGLRSYYPGFLDMFAKALRQAGYISVKFHFLGTGKSAGNFEDKTTGAMLKNYTDVLDFLEKQPEISNIGLVGRSNAGCLAVIHGPDKRVGAYALLAPAAYFAKEMEKFVENAEKKGKFFYHTSFKRKHTKGEGRLPFTFISEIKKFEPLIFKNAPKLKRVILFQSTKDEASPLEEGHFDYYKKHLPNPKKMVLIEGGNHSYKGHKKFVIRETVKWMKKYLSK